MSILSVRRAAALVPIMPIMPSFSFIRAASPRILVGVKRPKKQRKEFEKRLNGWKNGNEANRSILFLCISNADFLFLENLPIHLFRQCTVDKIQKLLFREMKLASHFGNEVGTE